MIKNPNEFKWTPPDWHLQYNICRYSQRYALPCGTQRTECEKCLMYQLNLGDHFNALHPDKAIEHYCDRCGQKLSRVDLAVYLDISNRGGVSMITQELCYSCASELIEWAQKKA